MNFPPFFSQIFKKKLRASQKKISYYFQIFIQNKTKSFEPWQHAQTFHNFCFSLKKFIFHFENKTKVNKKHPIFWTMNIFGLLLLNNNERTLSNENQNKQKVLYILDTLILKVKAKFTMSSHLVTKCRIKSPPNFSDRQFFILK